MSGTQASRPGVTRTSSSGPENYACPFAKRDPIKYSHFNLDSSNDQEYRSCSTGVMRNISRLKQHLSRTHKDEISGEQYKLVMERISGDHAQGWYNIYHILFPDQPLPATPYAEFVTGEHMRRLFGHLAQRLPLYLYQMGCATEFPGRPVAPLQQDTRFATRPDQIYQALQRCAQEFGQAQGLSHIFRTKSPSMDLGSSSKTTTRARNRPQDPRMAQSMGTFSTGNIPDDDDDDDDEMSGTSGSEEFEEELALRTIKDLNTHYEQMRMNPNYTSAPSPVSPPYTAYDYQQQVAYDRSKILVAQQRLRRTI